MPAMVDLGEKAFLKALLPQLNQAENFVNGFGHDASIVDIGLEKLLAFKIDRAPTPVALSRGWCDHRLWGRLAVVANVSDLLAAGSLPRALMLSIVVPRSYDAGATAEIIIGCQESCEQHGIVFVGGDTKEGSVVQVVGAAIGTVEKDFYLGRQKANPGDHLIIAGKLGGFSGALSMLDAKNEDISNNEDLLCCLTMPTARVDEAVYISQNQLARSACDLSDGLTDALGIFCSDGVGIELHEGKLPLHDNAVLAASKFSSAVYRYAFGVGDWAIAFVVPDVSVSRLFDGVPEGLEFADIGTFNSTGKCGVRMIDGSSEPFPTTINEHFRLRLEDDTTYLQALLLGN